MKKKLWYQRKVNSVQEACAKCFAVHKFEIFQITWKKWNKEHQTLNFQFFETIFSILMLFLFCFFMWFSRFQILISEPQIIWRNLLVLSWLYQSSEIFTNQTITNHRDIYNSAVFTEVNFLIIPFLQNERVLTCRPNKRVGRR